MKGKIPESIDDYIADFPKPIRQLLEEVRSTISKAAPLATEAIKYAMPTFVLDGNLVHFAAFTSHIGFYPTPTGTEEFRKELAKYKTGKGSVQFPLDEPMPLALISRIVKFRVAETTAKKMAKSSAKNSAKTAASNVAKNIKNTSKSSAKNSVKTPASNVAKNNVKYTPKNIAKPVKNK